MHFKMLYALCFNLDQSKILSSGNGFNPIPNAKILDGFKLKAFTDDNLKVIKMMIYVLDWVEKHSEKGENADYQHFLLFPQCFQKPSCPRSLKVRIV